MFTYYNNSYVKMSFFFFFLLILMNSYDIWHAVTVRLTVLTKPIVGFAKNANETYR